MRRASPIEMYVRAVACSSQPKHCGSCRDNADRGNSLGAHVFESSNSSREQNRRFPQRCNDGDGCLRYDPECQSVGGARTETAYHREVKMLRRVAAENCALYGERRSLLFNRCIERSALIQFPESCPRYHYYKGLFRLRSYTPVRDSAGRWPIARFPPVTALPDYQPLPFEPPREEPRCRT